MYVGVVEKVWEAQQDKGGPLTCSELAPILRVPVLNVHGHVVKSTKVVGCKWPFDWAINLKSPDWDRNVFYPYVYWVTRGTHHRSDAR